MAGVRRCLLLFFFLFQMAAFGASAPLEPGREEGEGEGGAVGGAEVEKTEETPKEGSVFISHDGSSTLIKPSESRTSPSEEISLGSPPKTDETEAKEGQKTNKLKNVEQNPELSRHQESGILQDKADSQISDEKPDPKKLEPLPPAADSNQIHTSELDSAALKPHLNEAEKGEDLPLKPESPPDVQVSNSLSKKSDLEKVKETPKKHLSDAPVSDSTSKQLDPKVKETPKSLPPAVTVADSTSKKSDSKEFKEHPKDVPSDVSVSNTLPKKPDLKGVKETQNVPLSDGNKADQNGILTKLKPSQPAETVSGSPEKSVQNGKLPTTVENNLSDISVPKDEDDEDDGMEEDELMGDGKVGEEIAGASPSEKEEAKSSPAGPAPKNESENSHFFAYLVTTAIVVAALYIAYHNKRKIIAFALEGKKSKVIRRPKSSDYQRLDQKI
ncbi:trans-Golgi network integral membrane protein 2 [Anolis carolinensis]|uniref:trans-Golgi network integral membrane protein 2 n=1 Tax=Anolis carolinensis TaxID=28377 RepID=UPI002F2B6AE5